MRFTVLPGMLACVVLFEAVAAWLTPRWTPEGFAFGVPVTAEWRASQEARRIVRGYRMRAMAAAALALVVVGIISAKGWIEASAAAPLIAVFGMFWGYGWAHRRTWPHAVQTTGPQVASTSVVRPRPAIASIWAQLLPFGVLAAAALCLALRWDDIPERFPIHWNAAGEVNAWATRTAFTVFSPVVSAAVLCAALYLMLFGTLNWSRRGAPGAAAERVFEQRRLVSTVVFGAECLVAVIHGGISLMPLVQNPHVLVALTITATGVFVLAIPIWMTVLARRLPRGAAAAEARPPEPLQHWKWGLFYVNRNDPAVFVEKRFGFGYTLNFANPIAWLVLALLLLPAVLIPLVRFLTSRH